MSPTSDAMPFFEEPEPPEPVGPPVRHYQAFPFHPPHNAVPGRLPWAIEVARTPNTVLILSDVAVYPQGFGYRLDGWLRPGSEPVYGPYAGEEGTGVRSGWLLDGVTKIGAAVDRGPRGGEDPFAPGRPDQPRIAGGSSTFGGIRMDSSAWVYPLPEGTTLEFVVAWPERGIPETFRPVDLGELRSAAAQSEVLWDLPSEPPPNEGGFGWFAYAPHPR